MATNAPFDRLLIVEDNLIDTMIITRVLQKAGLAAYIDNVTNGEEALSYLFACQRAMSYPDVILLDMEMPLMNGFQFLQQCLDTNLLTGASVKVVVLTSSINPNDQQKAAFYPLAGFLNKPLNLESLKGTLEVI